MFNIAGIPAWSSLKCTLNADVWKVSHLATSAEVIFRVLRSCHLPHDTMCTPFTSCYFAFSLLAAGDIRTESVRLTKFNQFWQKEHLCGPYYGRENFTISLFVIFIFLKCRVNWAWPARKLGADFAAQCTNQIWHRTYKATCNDISRTY